MNDDYSNNPLQAVSSHSFQNSTIGDAPPIGTETNAASLLSTRAGNVPIVGRDNLVARGGDFSRLACADVDTDDSSSATSPTITNHAPQDVNPKPKHGKDPSNKNHKKQHVI